MINKEYKKLIVKKNTYDKTKFEIKILNSIEDELNIALVYDNIQFDNLIDYYNVIDIPTLISNINYIISEVIPNIEGWDSNINLNLIKISIVEDLEPDGLTTFKDYVLTYKNFILTLNNTWLN